MHSRRFACFLLGIWFGGELLLAWTGAFGLLPLDRMRDDPPPAAAIQMKEAGQAGAILLRYEAAERMRGLQYHWGLAEIGIIAGLLMFLLFGTQEGKMTLAISLTLLAIVLLQRLVLVPEISALGRMLDFAPAAAYGADRARVVVLDNFYWGITLIKWATAAILLMRLILHRSSKFRQEIDAIDNPDYGHVDG